ncbi:MAG: molecular chaperone DnaJ [Firmicutes bacterium]|nr:molecular chaperone DnaJ [Bacillota bacterium]
MTTTKRDYYEVLGVPRDATPEQIKSAYRKAALRWHPDRNPANHKEAEERFREATEAYSVLSDPQKRAAYDAYGHAGLSGQVVFDADFGRSIFEEFQDIFGDLFGFEQIFGSGRGRRTSRPQRGSDLRYDLKLSFEEAARGTRMKIKVPRREVCATCRGSGARPGTQRVSCQTCGGRGQVVYQQGFFTLTRTCPVCHGQGQVIREVCPSCRGEGRVQLERTVEVRIPAGVDSHTRLRIAGEGEAGRNGGPPGDLYVVLEVEEHPFFERRNSDLYCTIPINIAQATLGAEISVPTLNGTETLKIPPGTQSGSVFRLKGHGLPDPHGGARGDLFVHIRVLTPERLTREQRRLFEQLAETLEAENRPAERSSRFFEKVRDIFS